MLWWSALRTRSFNFAAICTGNLSSLNFPLAFGCPLRWSKSSWGHLPKSHTAWCSKDWHFQCWRFQAEGDRGSTGSRRAAWCSKAETYSECCSAVSEHARRRGDTTSLANLSRPVLPIWNWMGSWTLPMGSWSTPANSVGWGAMSSYSWGEPWWTRARGKPRVLEGPDIVWVVWVPHYLTRAHIRSRHVSFVSA